MKLRDFMKALQPLAILGISLDYTSCVEMLLG